MSKAFGDKAHHNRTKVKVLTLCPGITETPMITEVSGRNLGGPYQALLELAQGHFVMQKCVCLIVSRIIITFPFILDLKV
jgi:short-subunit dehydrogenase